MFGRKVREINKSNELRWNAKGRRSSIEKAHSVATRGIDVYNEVWRQCIGWPKSIRMHCLSVAFYRQCKSNAGFIYNRRQFLVCQFATKQLSLPVLSFRSLVPFASRHFPLPSLTFSTWMEHPELVLLISAVLPCRRTGRRLQRFSEALKPAFKFGNGLPRAE